MAENSITVNIKLSGAGETFEHNINTDHTVEQVITALLQIKTEYKKDATTLVRKGRILKPHQVIKDIGVKQGETLHLVNKAAKSDENEDGKDEDEQQQDQPQQNDPFAAMFGGGMGGMFPGMGMPGMGMGAMPGMGAGLPGQMPFGFNPEMISNMLNNPMVQSMMTDFFSDPAKMKDLFEQNPMLSQMAEGNENLQELINDPNKLKDAMNPDKIQEHIKGMQQQFSGEEDDNKNSPFTGMPPIGSTDPSMSGMPDFQSMMGNFDPNMLNDIMAGFKLSGPGASSSGSADQYKDMSDSELKTAFKAQLEEMETMGFTDEKANIEILKETGGDASQAIEKSLEKMGQS